MKRLGSSGRVGSSLVVSAVALGCSAEAGEIIAISESKIGIDRAEYAARFAPVVYFDQVVPGDSGKQSKCLPQSAEPYYQARKSGYRGRICNQDARSLPEAPSYYEASEVSGSLFLTYWFF